MKRILYALKYSLEGILFAFRSEAAFRQVCILALVAILYGVIYVRNPLYMMAIFFVSFLIIIVELLNTGIEKAIDRISLERHPLAKAAKDVGSAAQFFALILYVIILIYSYNS